MGKPVAIVFGVGAEQGSALRAAYTAPSPSALPQGEDEGKLTLACFPRGLLK